MKGYNNVQCDRQWIRRIMREEKSLIDTFNQRPYQRVDDTFKQYGSSFYQAPVNGNLRDSDAVSSNLHRLIGLDRSKSLANGGSK